MIVIPAPDRPGAGVLAVARGAGGSVITRAASLAPLRLLTPRNHGDAVWAFLSSLGGGLVDGDDVALDVEVGAGASLLLATQASTKVYRSDGRGCTQHLRADVGDDGLLVVLPDPVVCYAGARLEQSLDVRLGARASVIVVDALTSGRAARGERWAFARYRSAIAIERAGTLLIRDVVELDPDAGALDARMGGWDALATVIAIGPRAPRPVPSRAPDWLAAVSDVSSGTLLRGAARSAAALHRGVRAALSELPALLGDDPFARKW